MEISTRRRAPRAARAFGVVGALTTAPGRAVWTWSPAGSVAGGGTGLDPKRAWDPEADALVASLIDRGDVPAVNALLRAWTRNGQALPAGLPADVAAFIEKARTLPSWADPDQLATAERFNEKRRLYLGLLYGLASGMMSTAIPEEARAVYHSKGGAALRERVSKTAKLGHDIMAPGSFGADGELIVTCVKTRLVHAAVRRLLPGSPGWAADTHASVPISQADLMVTWHSLPTTVMRALRSWKVPIPASESDAFLHSWQLCGHLLGIMDEYLPASWDEAEAQAKQVLTPVLGPTDEGVALAEALLDLAHGIDASVFSRPMMCAMTRFLLGDKFCAWTRLDETPVLTALIDSSWGPFIMVREGLLPFPLAPAAYWTFDEFLRQFTLLFLAEAEPLGIEIPEPDRAG